MAFIAVYDACVFYPYTVRDLLIRLAMKNLFQAKWTDKILDECFNNLRRDRPDLNPQRLARTRKLMNDAVRDCLVVGYEDADYIRGRCMKTAITVRRDGSVTLETRGRGESAPHWIDRLKGKERLQLVQ